MKSSTVRKTFILAFFLCIAWFSPSLHAQEIDYWNDTDAINTTVSYLNETENQVLVELNKVRTNPARYAQEYITPLLTRFTNEDPNIRVTDDGRNLMTDEGPKAVKECIAELKKAMAVPPLKPSKGMSKAAKDHNRDQGPAGRIGHQGFDNSDPFTRMNRYGTWQSIAGENISYGESSAREIVIQLLIDDGVANRGHRTNIMEEKFLVVGIAVGTHKFYDWMCTMDLAGGYVEK
jgi:uncharacterized protein YkwD